MAETSRTIATNISVNTSQANAGLKQHGLAWENLGRQANKSLKLFAGALFTRVAGRALEDFGKKILGVAKSATDLAIEFDAGMRNIRTQTDLTDKAFGKLSTNTLKAMSKLPQPMEEIQATMYDLFSSTDIGARDAAKAVELFGKAATAGSTDMDVAARAAISTMNAMGLGAKDLRDILDTQFQMVRFGAGTYEEFSTALGDVLPSAKGAGQSINDLGGALAFASRALGSVPKAAISVARAMDLIVRPENIKGMKEVLNVEVIDKATGEYRHLSDIMTDVGKAMEGMSGPQRTQALKEIFGVGEIRAMRFFKVAIPGYRDLARLTDRVSDHTGALNDAFEKMAGNVGVQMDIIKNRLRVIGITLASTFLPTISKAVDFINKLIDAFNKLDPDVKNNIVRAILLAGAWALVTGKVLKVVSAFLGLLSMVSLISHGIPFLIVILGSMALAVGAIAAGAILLIQNWEQVRPFFEELFKRVSESALEAWEAIQGWWRDNADQILETVQEFAKVVGSFLVAGFEALADVMPIVLDIMGKLLNILIDIVTPALKLGEALLDKIAPALQIIAPILPGILAAFIGLLVIRKITTSAFLLATALKRIAGLTVGQSLARVFLNIAPKAAATAAAGSAAAGVAGSVAASAGGGAAAAAAARAAPRFMAASGKIVAAATGVTTAASAATGSTGILATTLGSLGPAAVLAATGLGLVALAMDAASAKGEILAIDTKKNTDALESGETTVAGLMKRRKEIMDNIARAEAKQATTGAAGRGAIGRQKQLLDAVNAALAEYSDKQRESTDALTDTTKAQKDLNTIMKDVILTNEQQATHIGNLTNELHLQGGELTTSQQKWLNLMLTHGQYGDAVKFLNDLTKDQTELMRIVNGEAAKGIIQQAASAAQIGDTSTAYQKIRTAVKRYRDELTVAERKAINAALAEGDLKTAILLTNRALDDNKNKQKDSNKAIDDTVTKVANGTVKFDKYREAILAIPKTVNTKVTADTSSAQTTVRNLINLIKQGVNIPIGIIRAEGAQFGMHEYVHSPTLILAGEAGSERVDITPLGQSGQNIARDASAAGTGVTLNFSGIHQHDANEIIREIEWSRRTKGW